MPRPVVIAEPGWLERVPAPAVEEAEPLDVWGTIRNGLQLQEHARHAHVAEKLDRYGTQRAALLQLERARYYLPFIVSEIVARDLPLELALLPFVESALDPYAFSHGGAAGLWQLMPATARHIGVEMNWWYDGRRDIVESTSAALDYLESLHAQFDDWLLALAAYNGGQGRIRRALQNAGPEATFWDLRLPAETQRFVPRVLALATLVADPERFGLELQPLEPAPSFAATEVAGQIDLTDVAAKADVPLEALFMLNAGLNHGATPPAPHRVLVPSDYLEQFEAVLSAEAEPPTWSEYQVSRGDTLSAIAGRHGTTVAEIRSANNLNGHLIRQGQRLIIPNGTHRASSQVPPNPLLQTRSATSRYRVQAGDSLWTISRRFDTTVNQLVRLNRLDPGAPLRIGQLLTVPAQSAQPTDRAQRRVYYRVRQGDSLYAIASRFNVTVAQLVSWNRLDRNAFLQPGQRLIIMVDIRSDWS